MCLQSQECDLAKKSEVPISTKKKMVLTGMLGPLVSRSRKACLTLLGQRLWEVSPIVSKPGVTNV